MVQPMVDLVEIVKENSSLQTDYNPAVIGFPIYHVTKYWFSIIDCLGGGIFFKSHPSFLFL